MVSSSTCSASAPAAAAWRAAAGPRQVEGALRLLACQPPGLGLALAVGQLAQVDRPAVASGGAAGSDDLDRLALRRGEGGAQGLVAAHDLAESALAARRRRGRPRGGAPRACCRQGCPAPAGRGTTAAAGRRRAAAGRRADWRMRRRRVRSGRGRRRPIRGGTDAARQVRRRVGASNRPRRGSSTSKASRSAGDDLRGQQRVAAQLEEVVVNAHAARSSSTSAQMPASDLLDGRRERRCSLPRVASVTLGRRQRLAVHLAVGRERQPVQEHEGRRHHVVGQARAEAARRSSATLGLGFPSA